MSKNNPSNENLKDAEINIQNEMEKLNEKISQYAKKSELITKRNIFIDKKEKIEDLIALQGTDFDDFEESKIFKIIIEETDPKGVKISITKNYLVREITQFILFKILEKICELEQQIIK